MAFAKDDENPDDLEATIRQRIRSQYTDPSQDPTYQASSDLAGDQPIDPAPFDAAANQPTTPGQPVATAQQPSAPAPFSGGGGPPLPWDPYYQANNTANNVTNAPAPVGPQINFDNSPIAAAPSPSSPSGFDPGAVTQWLNQAYPGRGVTQKDLDYWQSVWPSLVARGQQLGDPNYARNRVLGMGAGGADIATAGPYANGQGYSQPNAAAATGSVYQPGSNAAPVAGQGSVAQNFVAGLQAPNGIWGSDFTAQIRKILMDRLAQAQQPVDPNDPTITNSLTAARDEASRATDKERTDLAERLYAQGGLNTDALNQSIQQSGERNATALGGLRATLMQRQVEAKQTELRDLMQMALASGDSESARQIQVQLAALNAQMQEEGWGIDLAKFTADLNQRAALAGLGA